jgi:hypothetical protein
MSDKIAELAKRWKEILGLIGLLVSMGLSTYTWITTKFALKEYVDYNNCYLEKRLQGSDYTMKISVLTAELNIKQKDFDAWEVRFGNRAVPIMEMSNFRKMTDDVNRLQGEIRDFEIKKKVQDDRDCLKEARLTR